MTLKTGTFGKILRVFKAHFHPLKDYESGYVLAPTMVNIQLLLYFRAGARTQAPLIPGPQGEDGSPHCRAHSSRALPAFCITNC